MARRNLVVLPSGYKEKLPNEFYCWGEISDVGIITKKEQVEKQLQDAFGSITIEEDETTPETDYVLKVLGKDSGARIVIPFDAVIKTAYYDKETKNIVLVIVTAEGDKEIKVNVSDLVDTYTGDNTTIKVENNVISVTENVMANFDKIKESITAEIERAKKAEQEIEDKIPSVEGLASEQYVDTLVSIEQSRATNAESELLNKIEENTTSIEAISDEYKSADERLKSDLEKEITEATKNSVEWEYSTEERKHIVLDNHDSILGKSTDGTTYNLAMVSKWDVADFGSSRLHTNLNSKDGQVTINDSKIIATLDDIAASEEHIQEALDDKADKEHTHIINDVDNLQNILDSKLDDDDIQKILDEEIYDLFNIEIVKPIEFISKEMNNPSENYAVIGNGETLSLTSTKSIAAHDLKLSNVTIYSEASNKGLLSVNSNNVEIENVIVSGSWDKSVGGNTMMTLNNTENVSIKNTSFNRTNGYNAIEIGLDGKGSTETIVIDGLEINEKLSNNGINIFSFKDNANIIIQNCHFTETSNPIRISNAQYAKNVNILVKNCTFDKWESNSPMYAGLILFQDYTSKTQEETFEKKAFATFEITIDNVTGPYGKIDKSSTIEELCGSGIVNKQLIYVYGNKTGVIPYSDNMYPSLTIK